MTKLAFVMHGPIGGQVIEMLDEDFAQAESDGWAMDFEAANKGGNPDPFAGFNTEPHAKAEAYLQRMAAGASYSTREMKAEPEPPKPAKPAAENDDDEEKPTKAKPGRPRKT